MHIDIAIYDGFDELDAIGPLEVLRRAGRLGADLQCQIVTRTECSEVTTAHGARLIPDGVHTPGADLLIVPGGGWAARAEAGAWGEVRRGDWLPLLAQAAASGTLIAGVCTGTMLLAHAGVIGNRRASTHHTAWADLAATGATLVKDRVVDDGDLITSGGVTSGLDLALWVVERYVGTRLADQIAGQIEYRRFRPAAATATS